MELWSELQYAVRERCVWFVAGGNPCVNGGRGAMNSESLQHRLERLDLGMVWIDTENRVTGFNEVAWQLLAPAGEQTLGVSRDRLIGIDLLALHPFKSREKLALLLGAKKPREWIS